jgi:hypothetical protein
VSGYSVYEFLGMKLLGASAVAALWVTAVAALPAQDTAQLSENEITFSEPKYFREYTGSRSQVSMSAASQCYENEMDC